MLHASITLPNCCPLEIGHIDFEYTSSAVKFLFFPFISLLKEVGFKILI